MCTATSGANTDGFIVGNQTITISGRFKKETGIFMNFGAPSPQTGMITSWSFHYSCVPLRSNPYHATLMMYRLNSTTSQYQVLSESIQSITVECADTGVTLRGNRMLMAEEQFRVEKGDIVAVCLPNDDMEPLRIASTRLFSINRDRESGDIGEFSVSREEGCSTDRLRLQTINLQDLDLRQNFQLHLYAEAITGIIGDRYTKILPW